MHILAGLVPLCRTPSVLLQVLLHEPDAAAAASCKQDVANLLLRLLLHLTASWPPPPLAELALEAISAPGAAALLPSPASVTAPVPLTLAGQQAAVAATAAAGPDTAAGAAASSSRAGQPGLNTTDSGAGNEASAAAEVVCSLLQLLQEAGHTSWQSLAGETGDEAAGAALAALYASCLDAAGPAGGEVLQLPESAVETLQVGRPNTPVLLQSVSTHSVMKPAALHIVQLCCCLFMQPQLP
jgi:hypothetical protein